MIAAAGAFLERYPELAVYLAVAFGHLIGRLSIRGISLGAVTGSLFAGLLIGQIADVAVPGMAKSILFMLFLFGIGYSVGPQFLPSLRREGMKPVLLAVVVAVTGLVAATFIAKILDLDAGYAAGLLSGALTESPAIGTATEAISRLPLPEDQRALLTSHVAVADAVCYLFGVVFVVLFLSEIAPRLVKIDLREEAQALERSFGIESTRPNLFSAWRRIELRAFRLGDDAPSVGLTIAAAEKRVPDARVFVLRIRRGADIIEATPDLLLLADDIVAVSGPRKTLVALLGNLAAEVEDQALLDVPVSLAQVRVTNRAAIGETLGDLANAEWARGLYLQKVTRGGQELPIAPRIVLDRGDILHLVGPDGVVQSAASNLGVVIGPVAETDFVTLGIGIFVGGMIGVLLTFPIAGMQLSLSSSVGVLLAGLAVGHLRTYYPLLGGIPDAGVQLMTSFGLAAFVGMVGLHAGPIFFTALADVGLGLVMGGAVVTAAPMIVGLIFGRFVLRMNPILLLGALAGAQTVTAAMAAVQSRSSSFVAVLGYTPAYPIGHVLLTAWGTVIVELMAP
ncbi:aspartate:alanine exchanger family transporter [Xanthobacter flavus]|uniref:aspartate:alanine exchanger family transporter n=1 Tax=Xanthobacter flavus TaxID=281 RepID=UPI003727776A